MLAVAVIEVAARLRQRDGRSAAYQSVVHHLYFRQQHTRVRRIDVDVINRYAEREMCPSAWMIMKRKLSHWNGSGVAIARVLPFGRCHLAMLGRDET